MKWLIAFSNNFVFSSYSVFLFLLLVCASSCQKRPKKESSNIDIVIRALKSADQQKEFLENILDEDQAIRAKLTKAREQYGYNSKEDRQVGSDMSKVDNSNLKLIESYLKIHGHPTKKDHGEKAVRAPYLVVHHASNIEPRYTNFKFLHQAYLDGDLDGGHFTFYLNRLYDMEYGHRIDWDRPFREEEEVDTLLKSLDLINRGI